MNKIQSLFLALIVVSLSACAPAYYEAAYYEPASSIGYNQYAYYPYAGRSSGYGSIEVTLFSDRTYVGAYFAPVSLVIYDGDFVEVPVRDKHGHNKKLYAHYHRGDLHFDSSRQCASIPGSSRFRYDARWDGGYSYNHISAGNDYDLSGYSLTVRKHDGLARAGSGVKQEGDTKISNRSAGQPQQNVPRSVQVNRNINVSNRYVGNNSAVKVIQPIQVNKGAVGKEKTTSNSGNLFRRIKKEVNKSIANNPKNNTYSARSADKKQPLVAANLKKTKIATVPNKPQNVTSANVKNVKNQSGRSLVKNKPGKKSKEVTVEEIVAVAEEKGSFDNYEHRPLRDNTHKR